MEEVYPFLEPDWEEAHSAVVGHSYSFSQSSLKSTKLADFIGSYLGFGMPVVDSSALDWLGQLASTEVADFVAVAGNANLMEPRAILLAITASPCDPFTTESTFRGFGRPY